MGIGVRDLTFTFPFINISIPTFTLIVVRSGRGGERGKTSGGGCKWLRGGDK